MNKYVVQSEEMEQSGRGAEDVAQWRTSRSIGWSEVSNGVKRQPMFVVLTMRRLNNGFDCRQRRRGYCIGVGGGGAATMMTIAFDGGGDGEKSLWL